MPASHLRIIAAATWVVATAAAPTPLGSIAIGLAVTASTAYLIERARTDRQELIRFGASIQAGAS